MATIALQGEYLKVGTIRCARRGCGTPRNGDVCPKCGGVSMAIVVYFKGRHWWFRHNERGRPLKDVAEAKDLHGKIRLAINNRTFWPEDFTYKNIRLRTFAAQADNWLEQKEEEADAGALSHETLKDYRGYARLYFRPFFGAVDVREIAFAALENFKDALPRSLKLKTRRNVLNALHALFRRMHRKGIIQAMPPWPVLEGDDSHERTALTYDEQLEGLSGFPEEHREAREAIECGFELLLRPGELCALQIRDINIFNQQALIRRTWSGPRLRDTTKGRRKDWIPISDRAWEILAPRLADKAPENPIFVNPATGRAFRPKALNALWKAFSGTGVTHYEAGRHSGCTQLADDGVNTFIAQKLMRHADLRSTQKYTHPRTDGMRSHLNRRGRVELKVLHNGSITTPTGTEDK